MLHKLAGPAIDADRLGHIDVALVSHEQHPDNLDESGRALASNVPLALTTRPSAAKLGPNAVGLSPWERREIPAPSGVTLTVTATPARHGPAGIERIAGEVVGFVIGVAETNEDLVYVTGDTVWYSGTAEVARRYSPRVVLLFAGAARTRGPFHLTMDTNDARRARVGVRARDARSRASRGLGALHPVAGRHRGNFATLGIEGRLRKVAPGTACGSEQPRLHSCCRTTCRDACASGHCIRSISIHRDSSRSGARRCSRAPCCAARRRLSGSSTARALRVACVAALGDQRLSTRRVRRGRRARLRLRPAQNRPEPIDRAHCRDAWPDRLRVAASARKAVRA